jgi:carboxylesterase
MNADEPPSRLTVNTDEFFFDGSGLSALLVHGLTGTPYEMRYLGERMAAAGIRVMGVKLHGHASAPEDLGSSTHEKWYESVVHGFEELRQYGDPTVVVGLSMGAVLSARLAAEQGDAISGVGLLAPAFFLPAGTTAMVKGVGLLGQLPHKLFLHYDGDSDIYDRSARLVHPTCRLMPLSAPIELLKLSKIARAQLNKVTQPALVIGARDDHTCPCDKNVNYAMKHLGGERKKSIVLEQSYHVITVDAEKDRVASEVTSFVDQFRAPTRRIANG